MKKYTKRLLVVLCLLLLASASALAEYPAERYYAMGFTENYNVYTGPDTYYYRANGNARYGGGGVRYYGSDPGTGWLLIGYKTSGGLWRMGYVDSSAANYTRASDNYSLFTLSFEYLPYHTTVRSIITDDPMMNEHTPLCTLPANTNILYLCRWNSGWVYVEATGTSVGTVRGYIRPGNIEAGNAGDPAPAVTPRPRPTATPRPYITATPRPYVPATQRPYVTATQRPYVTATQRPYVTPAPNYSSDWETLYYNYLAYNSVAALQDMELIDLNFDGSPELLMRTGISGRDNRYQVLSVYGGAVQTSDYFAYDSTNADWQLSNGTQSGLVMVRNTSGSERQWLKVGGSTSGGSRYGAICSVTLQYGHVRESVVFTYDTPLPGYGGQSFYTVRGYSATRTQYNQELITFQSMYPRNAYYAPCFAQTNSASRLSTFSSLATTYKNDTSHRVFY